MKLNQLKGQPGIDVVDLLNPVYGGWSKYKSRLEMLRDWANHGCAFVRTRSDRGGFELEQTPSGKKEFLRFAPVLDMVGSPKINPLWEEEFKHLIDDLLNVNLLPYISLFGGCDLVRNINFMDKRHWAAVTLFAERVVRILNQMAGVDFLLEDANEAYALPWSDEEAAKKQIEFADFLYSLGVPYGRQTCSGLDKVFDATGKRRNSHVEYLQKYAFGDDKNTAQQILIRQGGASGERLYFSLHEISYPKDFQPDGYAGRPRVHNYANYSKKTLAVRMSTDGARKGAVGYSGIPTSELGEIYRLALEDILHPLAGKSALFSDLPQERVWLESSEVPGFKYAKMVFVETPKRLDVMSAVYEKVTGKAPINKGKFPPIVEPDIPTPVPEPEPDPQPEVKVKPKLFKFVKRFPFLSIHYSSWKKALNEEELKVHKDTVRLVLVVPGGLLAIGVVLYLAVAKLINWIF